MSETAAASDIEVPVETQAKIIKYYGGVFFDNAQKHIDELKDAPDKFPNLLTVKVDETSEHIGEMSMDGDTPLAKMIETLGDNFYLDTIKRFGVKSDTYDPKSGIHLDLDLAPMLKHLVKLKTTNSSRKYYVMFDWDRTLTKFEGLFPESDIFKAANITNETIKDKYREDMLRYLFGGRIGGGYLKNKDGILKRYEGKFRLDLIRAYISWLLSNGFGVFILTNNGSCGKLDFTNTVRAFHRDIPIANIICSKPEPFEGRKDLAAAASKAFSPAASAAASTSGGTQKRRRNKKRTRRRASKKRN